MAGTDRVRLGARAATGAAVLLSMVFGAATLGAQTPLLDARSEHDTTLTRTVQHSWRLRVPDDQPFRVVTFPGPTGELSGLLGPATDDWRRHATLVWVTGGWPPGGIDDGAWMPRPVANDQSAKVYRQLGMVVFYPTFRGGFGNGGAQESFYGEVDDLLAAIDWLRHQPSVDPDRIWLGGHSTGGTLVLLAAEAGVDVRGVVSFSPVARPGVYGAQHLAYDPTDAVEDGLRSPIDHLAGIRAPTLVITGTQDRNVLDLSAMDTASDHEPVSFVPVEGANHFDLLAPINLALARQLLHTKGRGPLRLTDRQAQAVCADPAVTAAVMRDLETREALRRSGLSFDRRIDVAFVFAADDQTRITALRAGVERLGYDVGAPREVAGEGGAPRYHFDAVKRVDLGDVGALVDRSVELAQVAAERGLDFLGWGVAPGPR